MWEAEICSQEVQQWEQRIWKQTSLKGKYCGRANQAGKAEVRNLRRPFQSPHHLKEHLSQKFYENVLFSSF